jgi:sporulation protein YlmC with PRC-barrel domain
MKRATLACSAAACIYLGLVTAPHAAPPPATATTASPAATQSLTAAPKPAEACLADLRTFGSKMQKDGYWFGEAGGGYGYPMGGFGYDSSMNGYPVGTASSYPRTRPGYEVRTLFAAANILARNGDQKSCEDVLATTSRVYDGYIAEMRSGKMRMRDAPNWQQEQIAAAQPVTAATVSFRADQLLDTNVRNAQDESLGSVEDLVMSPQTGKIAYVVISRGGIFGIDEKFVPVPWADFKVTPTKSLLVLTATKAAMDAAPQVNRGAFAAPGGFDQESQKVDAYWKTHLAANTAN